ncbi:hypothetical protein KJ596_04815 [Patescibacteria group bacterium]|nr:hypothetical protein [Patescibacteria group bacterium]MBU1868471.1 hypothetical protein [Patescibacteria group bacterium]
MASTKWFPKKLLPPAILLLSLAYLVFAVIHFYWRGDGCIPLVAAQRIINGELLYRDFFEFWMPGSFYLLAGIFKLFGQTLLITRITIFINSFCLFLLVFLIGANLNSSLMLGAFSLILFILTSASPSYNHNWLGLLFSSLIAYLSIFKRPITKTPTTLYLLGLINGLVISFIQWQGVAVYLAFLATTYLQEGGSVKKKSGHVLQYTLGAVVFPSFWCLFFWWKGVLPKLLYATIIFPFTHYPAGNMQQFPSLLWWSTTLFYLILWYFLSQKKLPLNPEIRSLTIWGIIFHFFTLISPSPGHSALSYAFTAPLIILFCSKIKPLIACLPSTPNSSVIAKLTHRKFIKRSTLKHSILLLGLIFFGGITIDFANRIFYFTHREIYPVYTTKGTLLADPQWNNKIAVITSFLEGASPLNNFVYVGPWSPFLYFIFPIQNPTHHAHLGPEHHTKKILTEIISDLEGKNVNTIIFLPSENAGRPYQTNLFTEYLEQNYQITVCLDPQSCDDHPSVKDAIWQNK